MTSLREAATQALEALEAFMQDSPRPYDALQGQAAMDALKAALAEPVQGPVANDDKVICPACCHQFRAIPPNVQQMMLDAGFEPPFTTPPQRKPLTEEEILSLFRTAGSPLLFARAIERAHGIV